MGSVKAGQKSLPWGSTDAASVRLHQIRYVQRQLIRMVAASGQQAKMLMAN